MSENKKKLTFKDLKKKFKANAYYNNPNNFGGEGEDHINISIQSKTKIGKIFDPAYLKVINYKHVGKFNSVLSIWYWVRSDDLDDNIRRLTGYKLKKYAEAKGIFGKYVPNFKAIIAYATWLKVKSYPGLIKEIKELNPEIKLLSYHSVKSSNLRVCSNYAALIIEIANEIIKAVRESREPDFNKFVDSPEQAGLMFMEGILSKVLSEEKIKELKESEDTLAEEEDYEEAEPSSDNALEQEEAEPSSDNTLEQEEAVRA